MIKKLLLHTIMSIKHQIINIDGKYQSNKEKSNFLFFDDMINIKEFDTNLLKIDKKSYENNEVLKKYNELWDGIKNEIETINGGKTSNRNSGEYDNDFMKIKLNSDDSLPWNKTLKLHNIRINIRSVFEEHSKFYP